MRNVASAIQNDKIKPKKVKIFDKLDNSFNLWLSFNPSNMKSISFKLALLLCFMQLLSSCMYRYIQQQDTGKLMTYPVIPHKNEVEVYFNPTFPTELFKVLIISSL